MNPLLSYLIQGIADETGHPFDVVFDVWQQDLGYDQTVCTLQAMHVETMRLGLDGNDNRIVWQS